ncbi:MAG: hypothetical protein JWQ18_2599, partial [Conexibacter sp.]|nr:hypothetical protein [Conexibacter sp.]
MARSDEDALPVPTRRELMKPYNHPYRLAARATWRMQPELRREVKIASGLVVVGAGVTAATALGLLLLGVGALLAAWSVVILALATTRNAVGLIRFWRAKSELRTIRERRPHAGEADPELAHDEFAVMVEDEGWLVTWRFRPLAFGARPGVGEIEVPGRPCYAAQPVDDRRFDAADVAVAAEQLV